MQVACHRGPPDAAVGSKVAKMVTGRGKVATRLPSTGLKMPKMAT